MRLLLYTFYIIIGYVILSNYFSTIILITCPCFSSNISIIYYNIQSDYELMPELKLMVYTTVT